MQQNQIQKAIELARKTGDKIIIFDASDDNKAYAIVPLDEYEDLVSNKDEVKDLTEDELLDKINRDIAAWKSEQGVEDLAIFTEKDQSLEDEYLLNDSKIASQNPVQKPRSPKAPERNSWQIPVKRKSAAEEIIDEDRQYLEEVDF